MIPTEILEERRRKWLGGKHHLGGWRPTVQLLTEVRKGFTEPHLSRDSGDGEARGYVRKSILGGRNSQC